MSLLISYFRVLRFASAIIASLLFFSVIAQAGEPHVISSPDTRTRAVITEMGGQLTYSVQWHDKQVLLPSRLDLFDGGKLEITRAESIASDTVWKPTWGQFSEIRDHYQGLVLHLSYDGGAGLRLECRVFNDGVGLRFSSGGQALAALDKVNFLSEYRWPQQGSMYWTNGERDPVGPVSLATFASDRKLKPKFPVVVESGDGYFAAAMESDLYSAKAFSLMTFGHTDGPNAVLAGESRASVKDTVWQTPWRLILVGRSPGDLLISTTPLNLAAPCELSDTSWIKPGKTLWDWRVHGYKAGEFTYGVDTESYLRFIDFAAENKIDYFLIDDDWFYAAKQDRLFATKDLNLPKIMTHGKKNDVGVLLYYDRRKGTLQNDVLFPHLAELGAPGTKYGFMGNNAAFTRGAIAAAAEQKLVINFHDSPCPMVGVERTLPNFLTREYCHAMLDGRRAFTPAGFLKMAMINALTGPLDQANGNYGLNGINAGSREKGVRQKQSYHSTVVSETARVLVIFSGLICLPDAPEEYEKKADLFDFIRRMPSTWDETLVFNSKIGESITTARRSGSEWFVGSVINEAGGELPIPLNFLASDQLYEVTFYADADDSHFKNNREAYQIRTKRTTSADTIQATLAPGGGHCMWIRPINPETP